MALRNPIRRIRPEKTGVSTPLGDLEQAVMRTIWGCGDLGCLGTDIVRSFEQDHPVAITTVLTTLERLRNKGLLRREREGKAYRYWAMMTEEQLQQRIVTGVLDRLIAQFPNAVATYFAQQGSLLDTESSDAAHLADLGSRLESLRSADEEVSDHD